jgi:hypothetical protein
LLSKKVKFLVVGAYAMGAYGYPRATGDIDIWIEASPANSEKTYRALKQFKAPLSEISTKTFCEKGVIFQIGIAPRRIDIITKIDGVDFEKAYKGRKYIKISRLNIPFISKSDLIKNKESTGREKDKVDAKYLKTK